MPPFLRGKTTLLLLLVLAGVFAVFVWRSYKGASEQNSNRTVATAFGSAMHQLEQAPPGIQRVDAFLERLKTIDASNASPQVRKALNNYIAAVEPSLAAAQSGHSIAPYDQEIAHAKQRLIDAVRENE